MQEWIYPDNNFTLYTKETNEINFIKLFSDLKPFDHHTLIWDFIKELITEEEMNKVCKEYFHIIIIHPKELNNSHLNLINNSKPKSLKVFNNCIFSKIDYLLSKF